MRRRKQAASTATQRLARPFRVVALCRSAAREYGAPTHAVARRVLRVYREGLRLDEARFLGLLDPAEPESRLADVAGRRKLRPLQHRLNPMALEAVTEDKAVFQRVCALAGLPVPEPFAVVYPGSTGWVADGPLPRTRDEWVSWLETSAPEEFVAKPCRASYGRGVRVLVRAEGGFDEVAGGRFTAAELYDALAAHPVAGGFLVQERLRNHSDLVRLSGTETLQTVRVITLVGRDRAVRLLKGQFKAVVGDGVVDNIQNGATGNAAVEVDLADGRLGAAFAPSPDRLRALPLEAHPRTGRPFREVTLPFWPEVVDLVLRASNALLPFSTIGWDVALTPSGPVLVEANAEWGPPNILGGVGAMVDELERELAPRP